ncbi:MAG: glycerophosphodiester phosphodiesterase family protein [Anaerolineae bacterium]|nr:glycerophosphodiester phosphodiesterase family protein [Anaerolineae bacterium]
MDWYAAETPLVVGHRGASASMPENTLAAFALAAEEGAHGVELDVRLAADGTVMVIHDATVDRTTNGTGRVRDLPAAEIQALDAGEGQTVATLDDVFLAFGPSLLYNVELKDFAVTDRGLVIAVADRIAAYHLENHVVVSSFNPLAVRRARRQLPKTTMVGLLWERGPRWLRHLGVQVEADHPHFSLVDQAYIAWARERQLRIHVWTVDDPAEAGRLAHLGVHAIITNYPQRIREALHT